MENPQAEYKKQTTGMGSFHYFKCPECGHYNVPFFPTPKIGSDSQCHHCRKFIKLIEPQE